MGITLLYPGHYPYPGRYPYYPGRYPWWGYRGYFGNGWYGYPGLPGDGIESIGWSGAYNQSGWYSDPVTRYPVYVYNADNGNPTYNQQQEIDRLNDEVARLRAGGRGARPGVPVTAAVAENSNPSVNGAGVRDHHRGNPELHVGKTLSGVHRTARPKIPIAELDVAATTKANDAI